jgi:hypothetical protein
MCIVEREHMVSLSGMQVAFASAEFLFEHPHSVTVSPQLETAPPDRPPAAGDGHSAAEIGGRRRRRRRRSAHGGGRLGEWSWSVLGGLNILF